MRTRCFFLILALATALGCLGEPQVMRHLAPDLPAASIVAERAEFRLGTDGREPALGAGWSYGEVDRGRNRSFRWALRPRSELDFVVLEPRPLVLELEGLPAPAPKAAVRVHIEVNGDRAGALEVEPGLASYRLAIDPELLTPGHNRLAMVYEGGGPSPAEGSDDPRAAIAMAWYRIAFAGLDQVNEEPRAENYRRLVIPFGSRVDFALTVPAGARFGSGPIEPVGSRSGRLKITLARDGLPLRELGAFAAASGLDLELGVAGATPARLSFAALGDPVTGPAGGGRLEGMAIEVPNLFWPSTEPPEPKPAAVAKPNILVYLADTLRADRLGCYGNERQVSPNIDRFAAGATLFENARAQASWTLPAVTSLFTGVWPPAHGVVLPSSKLAEEALTMAEILRDQGYSTAAVVANGFPSAEWGLAQGFDHHRKLPPGGRDSRRVREEGVAWLQARDESRPFFLYLHSLEPHNPYLPREEFRRRFAPGADEVYEAIRANPKRTRWDPTPEILDQLFALYDALIAQNDADFGLLLEYLEREGLFDDALIVFLSDHGEEFHEHGAWIHGSNLFAPTLDVPLIVKLPRQTTGRRVESPAQHVDLLPTLLDYLGLRGLHLEGRSLLTEAQGVGGPAPAPPIFSHTARYGNETRSVVDGGWKFIERREPARTREWLFDWDGDGGDRRSRLEQRPIHADVLRTALDRRLLEQPTTRSEEAVLDEATREDLRALGYIE